MRMSRMAALAVLAVGLATSVDARPAKLKAAKVDGADLTPGLSVEYAYPGDVRTLRDAYIAIGMGAEPGTPLTGLSYSSSSRTPNALTSRKKTHVAARITGYMKFDAPGVYTLDVLSNDGLQLTLGGREIIDHDERTPCESVGKVEVNVPSAGWYELEALWFQRQGGSCLEMNWAPEGGSMSAVPGSAFGY